jgi:hypothetical protein
MSETVTEPAPEAPESAPEPPPEPQLPQTDQAEPQHEPAPQAASVEELPAWAQKLLRDTRSDAAKYRTSAKELQDRFEQAEKAREQQMAGIAKALGLAPDEATPEQIAAERDAEKARADGERQRARQAAVELATYRAAATMGADGNALLDSRSFVSAIEGLDPSADDFAQRVKDAITEALETHPEWKAAPSARPEPPTTVPAKLEPTIPRANGEFSSNPERIEGQWTDDDVARARPEEVVEAMRKGLLRSLGAGTGHGRDRRANAR